MQKEHFIGTLLQKMVRIRYHKFAVTKMHQCFVGKHKLQDQITLEYDFL